MWIPHIDGLPFRNLGRDHGLSGKQAFLKVKEEIDSLPDNTTLTKNLCDPLRFCGILILDGKYLAVRGYDAKIPVIYGIDYLSHDIPVGDLFVAEDGTAFYRFFRTLREELHYPLRAVVADDRSGLKQALNQVFPYAKLQLCHNHYLNNLRDLLKIKTQEKYHHFFNSLMRHVFQAQTEVAVMAGLTHVFMKRAKKSQALSNIVLDIRDRREDLFNYLQIENCPNSTNLVELYNSHLEGRLKTIKGFQSFDSARKWFNAYLIRRRTKTLTDCKAKFKHLNGLTSLQMTIRDQRLWPTETPGIKLPQKAPER